MGGKTPTKEMKVPGLSEGATKNIPKSVKGKSKLPKIKPDGTVSNTTPELGGDLSNV